MYDRIRQFKSWAQDRGLLVWFGRGFDLRRPSKENYEEFLRVRDLSAQARQPCIFLDEVGACSIYPVRPMVCRTTRALTVCRSVTDGEMVRTPFDETLDLKVA